MKFIKQISLFLIQLPLAIIMIPFIVMFMLILVPFIIIALPFCFYNLYEAEERENRVRARIKKLNEMLEEGKIDQDEYDHEMEFIYF